MSDKNAKQFSQDTLSDLSMLEQISHDRIMSVLKNRYMRHDDIYTNIGPVLIAINPFKTMKLLYTEARIREYRGKKYFEMPPHPYSLIDDAYGNMITYHENQCIIICGESGSGKTETAKIILNYISSVTGKGAGVQQVKDRMLSSNPILEGFGNAKTINNNNSSRFGKYMVLHFDLSGEPIGGSVQQYLLEKSRVVGPARNERNFHIFYQVTSSASAEARQQFYIEKAEYFRYLNSSECYIVDGINDSADWAEMVQAMNTVGILKNEQDEILRVLSIILWLGNVDFVEDHATEKSSPRDTQVIAIIAHLLGVSEQVVVDGLCIRTITAGGRGEVFKKPCRGPEAEFNRDTLAKAMYSRLFDYLVNKINLSILPPEQDHAVIGILDIFGFEIFENNSFEQLCINFVNERLQQIFIELTLRTEQEEYNNEGIPWKHIDYYDNKPVCELIEGRPGILSVLDDTCATNKDDTNFVHTMNQLFSRHDRLQCGTNDFVLRHYAGDVRYQADGFTIKNKDTLFDDLIIMLQQSPHPFVKQHGWSQIDTSAAQKARPPTVGKVFREQVKALMGALMSCVPHYVRCIKPNHRKRPNDFDNDVISRQVEYLGLLENVRVRCAGYAYRSTFERFAKRYGILCEDVVTTMRNSGDQQKVMKLCDYLGWVKDREYAMGKTKIFIRKAAVLFTLEEQLERKIGAAVTIIQTAYRFYLQKRRYMELKACGYDALKIINKERRRLSISANVENRADYINVRQCQPAQVLLQQNNIKEEVLFADRGQVVKLREKRGFFGSLFSKPPRDTKSRIFMVSTHAVYCFKLKYSNPSKREPTDTRQYNVNNIAPVLYWRVPFSGISKINLSPYNDGYMVFHFPNDNPVRPQFVHIPRKTEFLAALYWAYDQDGKQPPLASVTSDSVLVNAKKQSYVSITWQRDDTLPADVSALTKHKKEKQNFIVGVGNGAPFSQSTEPYRPPKVDYKSGGRTILQAIRTVAGNGVDELAFNEGDQLYVVRDEDKGWYQCEHNGNVGWVQATDVRHVAGPGGGQKRPGPGAPQMGRPAPQMGGRPGAPPAPVQPSRAGLPPPPQQGLPGRNMAPPVPGPGGRPLPPAPGGAGARPPPPRF